MVSLLIILSLFILVCLSAIAEAGMDKLQFHFYESIFSNKRHKYWNPSISWSNKYKDGDPEKGEAFPFSTTLLVCLTDGWHCLKLIKNTTIFAAIFMAMLLIVNGFIAAFAFIIVLRAAYGYLFQLCFETIFSLKNKNTDER